MIHFSRDKFCTIVDLLCFEDFSEEYDLDSFYLSKLLKFMSLVMIRKNVYDVLAWHKFHKIN